MRLRKCLLAMGCAVVYIASAPGIVSGASAAYVHSDTGAANIRTGPTTNARVVDRFKNGRKLAIVCYVDNGWAKAWGHWSNRWFRFHYKMGRYRWIDEFIFAPLVAAQPRVPYCDPALPPADS